MKKLSLFILTSLILSSCNSESNEIKCKALTKEGIKHLDDGKIYSGNCLVYKNDIIAESRKIQNGIHKKSIGYWDTGEIKYTGGIKNDSLNGVYREYYKSGRIAKKGKFKKGYYHGRWKFVREDGVVLRVTKFNKGKVISEVNKN